MKCGGYVVSNVDAHKGDTLGHFENYFQLFRMAKQRADTIDRIHPLIAFYREVFSPSTASQLLCRSLHLREFTYTESRMICFGSLLQKGLRCATCQAPSAFQYLLLVFLPTLLQIHATLNRIWIVDAVCKPDKIYLCWVLRFHRMHFFSPTKAPLKLNYILMSFPIYFSSFFLFYFLANRKIIWIIWQRKLLSKKSETEIEVRIGKKDLDYRFFKFIFKWFNKE